MRNNLLFRHWAGVLCLMCAVIFNVQYVAATNVSGTTYASNLVANDNIVLTGNTVLFMNTDLTLTGISGDYTLEIQGSNTLTVNNPNGNAISVSSLNTISASLDITGSKDGLNVDQDITISGGSLVVHAGVDGVYSRNGSITMNGTFNLTSTNGRAIYARIGNVAITGDITASTSSSRMSAIEAGLADNSGFAPSNITITGSTVNVSAVNVAIHAYAGSVSVTGDATVTSSNEAAIQTTSIAGFGETFKSDVTLDGTFHLEGAPYAVVSGGKLMLKTGGSITSVGTLYALEAMTLNGDVDVDGRNAQAICCRWGDISITGNLIAKSASTSEPCVQAGFADNTGFAPGNITITGSTVNVSAVNVAIHAYAGSVSVTGDATVTSSNEAAIQTTSIARFGETFKSDVTLDGTFHLEGAPYAVVSGGKLMLKTGGSITSVGTLYALEAMTLNGDVDVDGRNAQAICCRWGDISITGNLIAKSASTSEPCVQAGFADNTGFASGGVIIFGGTVNIDAVTDAIKTHANGGINISGDVTVKSKKGAALFAKAIDLTNFNDKFYSSDITLAGTINLSGGKYGIVSGGGDITLQSGSLTSVGALYAMSDITINGDLNAKTTRPDVPCIQAGDADNKGFSEGNVTITGNNIIVSSVTDAIKSHARGNIRISGNANVYSLKGAAIYAFAIDFIGELYAGNVTLDGTIKLNGGQYGIVSGGGDITLQSGSLTSVGALYAMSDITINGDLNVKTELSDMTCIQAGSTTNTGFVIGNITINGETILVNSEHDAIKAIGGNIRLTGNATVASSNGAAVFAFGIEAFGESYEGDVILGTGEYNISGKEYSIVSHGAITLSSALKIISPTNGTISGYTIIDSSSETAKFVHISAPPISGAVALSTAPSPGNDLSFTLSGDIAEAEIENIWQISDDDVTWQDIVESPAGAPALDGVHQQRRAVTTLTYTPKESEMGKYLRVKVAAANHTGYIYSPSRQIAKKICTDVPVVPTLTNINDKVYLSNAKTTQEYIIFNYSKDASSLTASDWNNAVTPESEVGFFELGGSSNANNTVFTRVKETPSTLVGEQIAEARLYIGTSVYMTDVELSVSKTVGHFQNFNNELNCKVGDVIRCDASPVPSNATNWYGVSGSNWTVDFHNTGSQYGTFYEDAECTRPISSSSNYTTVYLKTLQEKNYLDVRILVYNSAIGYKTRYVQFNVTPDGYFPLLDYINGCDHTIAAGEKITGIEVSRRPFSGSVYGLTTEVSGDGTAPIVSFSLYETMTINAINATPGVYVYTPLQNGHPLNNNTTFTITVTDGKYAVDSLILRENAITADPNEELELVAQLMPSNSEAAITWTSSNTSVATVTNGIVTIAANAPIGAKATITATANGKSDECQITVSGKEYDLYVASTRVTSRNRDDILGDGRFAFDGMNTLAIKGNYTISNSANLVRNTGIDGLIIDVAQACTISQGSESYSTLFDLRKNTTIRGEQMTVNGNGVAFNTQGGTTLTLDSANLVVSAIMPFKGSSLSEDTLSIINSRLEVNASGSAAVFSFNGGISLTDCYIQTPTGGEIVDATIEDGNGSQVRNLLIVPHKEKRTAWMAFLPLEVNVREGDELEEPTLLNPEQLSVTYSSSDPSVATVDALTGDVTLVAAGSTVITATFAGNEEYNEASASYTLTVTPATYTVTWLQDDGTQIDQTVVEYGVVPTHADPSKPATAEYTYTFTGWTPNVVAVTGNATYTATYSSTKNTYTVTWLQDDGTLIDQTVVEYGVIPTHADPSKPATAEYTYTFTGWTPNVVAVTGNATYTATYSSTKNSYTVTFVDWNETVLKEDVVEYGSSATAPAAPTREGYTFDGWDKDFSNVTENMTVKATYTENVGTGIEDILVTPSEETRKLLIDGTLYILRPDGAIYNATGARVK